MQAYGRLSEDGRLFNAMMACGRDFDSAAAAGQVQQQHVEGARQALARLHACRVAHGDVHASNHPAA